MPCRSRKGRRLRGEVFPLGLGWWRPEMAEKRRDVIDMREGRFLRARESEIEAYNIGEHHAQCKCVRLCIKRRVSHAYLEGSVVERANVCGYVSFAGGAMPRLVRLGAVLLDFQIAVRGRGLEGNTH